MPISWHLGYCKGLLYLSLTYVSSAIARVQTFNHYSGCAELAVMQKSVLAIRDMIG